MQIFKAYINWLQKRKLRNLLTASIAFVLIPFVLVMFISFYMIAIIGQNTQNLNNKIALATNIKLLKDLNNARMLSIYEFAYSHDGKLLASYNQTESKISNCLSELKKLGINELTINNLENQNKAVTSTLIPAVESLENGSKKNAITVWRLNEINKASSKLLGDIAALEKQLSSELENASKSTVWAENISRRILFATIFVGIAIAMMVQLFIRAFIVNPFIELLKRLSDSSHKLAASSQELASSADTMSNTTTQISSAISQVANGAAEQSKDAAEALNMAQMISNAISQVASSAQNQVESVNDMAAGITQLTDAINNVSESASVVANVAEASSSVANKGKSAVGETVSGMSRIKDRVLDSANKIHTLGEKSKQIGEIIEVIDDIAEQTNLLALNAAIEAARAGEHGKGFAVVADEVRKLAERSARATGEIAELIKGIQKETMEAVEAMEKGTAEVEIGSELAENAGKAIEEMMDSIRQVVVQIGQVKENMAQMNEASLQVSKAVDQIAAISQETSATAEEVASSANQVVSSVDAIAAASEESAASAEQVTASAQQQSASIQQLNAQAQTLSAMSEDLAKLVEMFRV